MISIGILVPSRLTRHSVNPIKFFSMHIFLSRLWKFMCGNSSSPRSLVGETRSSRLTVGLTWRNAAAVFPRGFSSRSCDLPLLLLRAAKCILENNVCYTFPPFCSNTLSSVSTELDGFFSHVKPSREEIIRDRYWPWKFYDFTLTRVSEKGNSTETKRSKEMRCTIFFPLKCRDRRRVRWITAINVRRDATRRGRG